MVKLSLSGEQNATQGGGGTLPARTPAPHESVFEAEVLDCTHQNSRWKYDDSDDYKKEFNFKFRVLDTGDYFDRYFWGSAPEWFTNDPRCKMQRWVKSLYDEPVLPNGFELETDDLKGMRCIIVVHAKEKAVKDDGSHLNPDGTHKIVNWVADVLPSKASWSAPVSNPDDFDSF